jgi:hypothetical protein
MFVFGVDCEDHCISLSMMLCASATQAGAGGVHGTPGVVLYVDVDPSLFVFAFVRHQDIRKVHTPCISLEACFRFKIPVDGLSPVRMRR